MEEVVSCRDDQDEAMAISTSTNTNRPFLPSLHTLILQNLGSLRHIGGGGGSNEITYNNTIITISADDQLHVCFLFKYIIHIFNC